MKRSSPPRRRSPLASGGPPKKKKRTPDDYARIYGSVARVLFVQHLPCAACRRFLDCANHHIKTGGTSRKADYTTIIPLCGTCHTFWHDHGRKALEELHDFDAGAAAVMTEAKWIAHSVKLAVSQDSNSEYIGP